MAQTYIGSTVVIKGDVGGTDLLVVRGLVKGSIGMKSEVVIEEGGRVEGQIAAEQIDIRGELHGNVAATSRCQIKAGGKMHGDIRSPRILIAEGAVFRGKVDMDVTEGK